MHVPVLEKPNTCFKEIFQPLTALPMRQSAARWAVLGSDMVDQVEAANRKRLSRYIMPINTFVTELTNF